MNHNKFDEITTLVNAGIAVLLTGEKGSGKTTLAKQTAEHLNLPFYCVSMTRQTTLSHLMGFVNVNGEYIPSQLRKAADGGGIYLLDEIDAGDANVLLSLNTIENGYLSFPDGIVDLHEDFRLMATANPQDKHQHYVGRNKLDLATLDRFDIVNIDHDVKLEQTLVDNEVFAHINLMRTILAEHNSSVVVSIRDSLRYQKRKELGLVNGFMKRIAGDNPLVFEEYENRVRSIPKYTDQAECNTVDELWDLMKATEGQDPAGKFSNPYDEGFRPYKEAVAQADKYQHKFRTQQEFEEFKREFLAYTNKHGLFRAIEKAEEQFNRYDPYSYTNDKNGPNTKASYKQDRYEGEQRAKQKAKRAAPPIPNKYPPF